MNIVTQLFIKLGGGTPENFVKLYEEQKKEKEQKVR